MKFDEIKLDGLNTAEFEADGIKVSVRPGDAGCVDISADLGPVGENDRDALFKAMLEANHAFQGTAGSTLALDPGSGHAVLRRRVWIVEADSEEFLPELSVFMDKAREWRERLGENPAGGICNLSLSIV